MQFPIVTGPTGPTGALGPTGAAGPTGPTGAPVEFHNFSLSATNTTYSVVVGSIEFVFTYTTNLIISLSLQPAVPATTVLMDFRRFTYFDLTPEGQTANNYSLSGNYVADLYIYSQSNDLQKTWLRQRDPNTLLWSLCEYSVFSSGNGSRSTLWVNWIYRDVDLP